MQVDEYQFSLAEVVLSGALPEGTVFRSVPWGCNQRVQKVVVRVENGKMNACQFGVTLHFSMSTEGDEKRCQINVLKLPCPRDYGIMHKT